MGTARFRGVASASASRIGACGLQAGVARIRSQQLRMRAHARSNFGADHDSADPNHPRRPDHPERFWCRVAWRWFFDHRHQAGSRVVARHPRLCVAARTPPFAFGAAGLRGPKRSRSRLVWLSIKPAPARVAELADAGGLNPPPRKRVRVRTPPRAQQLSRSYRYR